MMMTTHYEKQTTYFLSILLILCCSDLQAQENCENIGFETGTFSGWQTDVLQMDNKTGVIYLMYDSLLSEGNDTLDPNLFVSQSTILNAQDAANRYDPVVLACGDSLSVVPPNGGNYSLKIGDEPGGGRVAVARRNFRKDGEFSYLLLQYAVLLENPDHQDHLQPFFEINIFDQDRNLYNCGKYRVTAAPSIPNFYSCGVGWRYRPWTAVAIDLASYEGDYFIAEFSVGDCAPGGHGGYAYIDAVCRSLEIEVEDYCSNSASATLSVFDGFADYRWSNGDRSSSSRMFDIKEGDVIWVEVTSYMGCVTTIYDTIPPPPEKANIEVEKLHEERICKGDSVQVTIDGENVDYVYWPDLDIEGKTVWLQPNVSRTYAALAGNVSGCEEVLVEVEVIPTEDVIWELVDQVVCEGDSVQLRIQFPDSINLDLYELYWEDFDIYGQTVNFLPQASANYFIQINDVKGCMKGREAINVILINKLEEAYTVESEQTICKGETITLTVNVTDEAISVFWPALELYGKQVMVQPESTGTYIFHLQDEQNCFFLEESINVQVLEEPLINFIQDSICINEPILLDASNEEYNYIWHNGDTEASKWTESSGWYKVTVFNDCFTIQDSIWVVLQPEYCGLVVPNAFSPNNDQINDQFKPLISCEVNFYNYYQFQIFDRWGRQVFKTNDLTKGWNGKYQFTHLPAGVYIWTAQYEDPFCRKLVETRGNVCLMR